MDIPMMTIPGHSRLFESARHWTSMSITYGKVSCDGKLKKAGLMLTSKQQRDPHHSPRFFALLLS